MKVIVETRCRCRQVIALQMPTEVVVLPFLGEPPVFEPNSGVQLLTFPDHRKFYNSGETDEALGLLIYREEIT